MRNRLWKSFAAGSLVLAVSALPLEGQDAEVTESERFELFTECARVRLFLAADEDVRTMAENRLRAARLYSEDREFSGTAPGLVLDEGRGRPQILFQKLVTDPITGIASWAYTWARFCCTDLSDLLDGFILDYLRVNEGYCG